MGNNYEEYMCLLERGNELCKSREVPMTFTTIQEVQEIYKKCWSLDSLLSDTPLIGASRLCYPDLVWGFIQCAKQTNTNIHTGETGELEKFLGYRNSYDETALEVAIKRDNLGVLKVLLDDVSLQELFTYRNHMGKTLVLSNHEYDEIIFKAMKVAAREKVNQSLTSISVSIDDEHQESVVYKECMMQPNTHPLSLQYRQSTPLDKLDDGQLELAPNGDTIIHLISEFGYADDARPILERHPSLIYSRNHNGETPLYVAAREGHINILELLISYVKTKNDMEALATRSTDKNNALHIAIENHHAQAVFWLVNEIPQLANCINDFNESPLYIAAQRGYHHIMRLILNECKERSLEGPNGKTALHAAVESDYFTRMSPTECIKSLLRENFDLLHIHDKHGWAPFHYAAYHDREEAIVTLLEADPLIGYQKTVGDDIHMSALHIAASRSHGRLLKYLTDCCPGSSDIIDSKGRNILHVAVESKQISVIHQLFGNEWLRIRLINQKDSNGNTPLHLVMASDIKISDIRIDDRVNMYVHNNNNQTPLEIASSEERRQILIEAMASGVWTDVKTCSSSHELSPVSESSHSKNENETGRQMISKVGDSLVVVVALIATATFAAAFTVPGGFDDDKGPERGMPILLRKAAYKAFVVSNALAFSSSCCVLFGYMRLQIYIVHTYEFGKKDKKEEEEEIDEYVDNILSLQYWLTGIAMVAMAFAFVTGTYVILASSHAFAISVCAMCVCIIIPLSFFPSKYFRCFHIILNAVFDR